MEDEYPCDECGVPLDDYDDGFLCEDCLAEEEADEEDDD